MKRKMKKFDDGGEVYNKEDEGILGGKVKYREDSEGRKYTAGKANPMDRNPSEQRYYSMDDVKGKLSGLFGGKSEDKSETYVDKQMKRAKEMPDVEEPRRQMTDYIKKSDSTSEPTGYKEDASEPVKKPAPRKAVSKIEAAAPAPKKAKAEEATSSKEVISKPTKDDKKPLGKDATRMPSGYEKLDTREKEAAPAKKGFSTNMGKTDEEREAQAKANREALADSVSGISKYFRNPFTEKREEKKEKPFVRKLNSKPTADQTKKMAKGGSVRSASARADGCAIRGKTRA